MDSPWTEYIAKGSRMWVRTNCVHHWQIKESVCLFREQGLYSAVVELNGPVFCGKLHGPVLYLTLEDAQKGCEAITGQIMALKEGA